MNVLEAYYKATEREVSAPSGITYRVRGLSSVEYGSALKGLPALLSSGEKREDGPSLEEVFSMQRAVCGAGTVAIVYEGQEMVGPFDAALWPALDVATVFLAIQEASGLSGAKADAARGAL